MKSFLQSLRGQLIVLLLVILLAAQVISVLFFVDERSLAVRAALGFEAAGRAASVARLLEEAPQELHASILRAANSPLVRFDLAENAIVERHSHQDGGAVEDRIRTLLGETFTREIRVDVHEIEGGILPLPHLSPDMAEMHVAMMRGDLSAIEMSVSIALSGGQWLNVETRFERPPLQWGWATVAPFLTTAAILIVAGFWFLLARILGPLRELAIASERLGRGEDTQPPAPRGPREIRDLTIAFANMQERLTRFVVERTRMLAAIGHDLRSPLTAMRVRLEMVEDDETRDRLAASVDEMQQMLDATLTFARGVDTSEQSERLQISDVFASLEEVYTGRLVIERLPPAEVMVRPVAFRRAVRNLIENADRYGGGASVKGHIDGQVVVIDVDDTGPGIPQDSIEEVFQPFHRLETSRSLETGGHGLGLSIARDIFRAHGGDVVLSNRDGGGLRARISIPAADEDSFGDVAENRTDAHDFSDPPIRHLATPSSLLGGRNDP